MVTTRETTRTHRYAGLDGGPPRIIPSHRQALLESEPEFPDAIAMLDERTYHSFDVRGVTRVFDLTIDDSGWAMIRRDEDFWQRSAGRFHGTDAIDGTGENSFDAGHTWQHDFSVSFARVG